jgi:hypothetical protein
LAGSKTYSENFIPKLLNAAAQPRISAAASIDKSNQQSPPLKENNFGAL